jgi:hypothetical protein
VSVSGPPPSTPASAPAGPAGLDRARLRAWLAAAVAALLVLLYLSVQFTYGAIHLPPPRLRPLAPGAVAHGTWADFRLLSLTRTERWGQEIGGGGGEPAPGATWVVAHLEVTPREHPQYVVCTLLLVSTDGRSWESALGTPSHDGETCVPYDEPESVRLGTRYPIVVGYQVPLAEADHLAGLALDPYGWRRYQLLRPPA